ncbi:MAG: CheR family methyltransferase [Methanocella sp.]
MNQQHFTIINEKILPALIMSQSHDNPIHVWIPSCSTGEEVYSIAITIQEFLEANNIHNQPVRMFGTDINSNI